MAYSGVLKKAIEIGKIEIILNKRANNILGVSIFFVLTVVGAFVRIPLPFTPVPITLQTFFVLLSGAVLGNRLGMSSQAIYILIGALGFPVFSGALGGVSRLFGPTGGYLFGFILASYLVGYFLRGNSNASFTKIVLSMFVGDLTIFIFGVSWLSIVLKISFIKALVLGFIPFIPGDIIKVLSAATIYHSIQTRCRQIF